MASTVFAGLDSAVADENGLLENTQVALLSLSGIAFAVKSFNMERDFRLLLWMGAWFCLSFILRELDVEDFAVPQWVVLIGSGTGRNLIMGAGWIVLGVLGIKSLPGLKGSFGYIARSRTALFMYAAGAMLLLGALSEEISGKEGMIWEETAETIGYFLLLLGAFFSTSIARK